MRISARNLRIGGASLIAVILVAGGYLLPGAQFPETKAVNAELTDELLASYVSKDTDGDGLPDWQEALYGTNLNVADTDGDGISDGEAVRQGLLTPTALASQLPNDPVGEEDIPGEPPTPDSFTDQFARTFFEAYMQASGGQPMSADAQQILMQRLLADFSARAGEALESSYTQVSVRTNANTSVQEYAASFERVLQSNDIDMGGETPLSLMQAVMENGSEPARQKLLALVNAETDTVQGLLAVSVPPALANEHLLAIRSTDSLAKATQHVVNYDKDPLGVMGAFIVYAPASRDFVDALRGIAIAVLTEGEPAPGTPGAYLVEVVRSVESL